MGSVPKGLSDSATPGPREILRALQQDFVSPSRLNGLSDEERTRELIGLGYLQAEFSPALVVKVREVLEAVGERPGHPNLWPCSIKYYRDNHGYSPHMNVELSWSVHWPGAPAPWEAEWNERPLPDELTRAETPPCTDLIVEPEQVFASKER